jgi:AraC-like DNA-binding protein
MSQLAEGMKLSRHYITKMLRGELKKNFFVMVNDYRMEEVKQMLQESQKRDDIAPYHGSRVCLQFQIVFQCVIQTTYWIYTIRIPQIGHKKAGAKVHSG